MHNYLHNYCAEQDLFDASITLQLSLISVYILRTSTPTSYILLYVILYYTLFVLVYRIFYSAAYAYSSGCHDLKKAQSVAHTLTCRGLSVAVV